MLTGKVGEYNAKNGTEYELLPEAAYDLTEEVLVKAGTPKSEEAVITVHAKGNIEAFKEYLLPGSACRCTKASLGSPYSVSCG